MIFSTNDFIDSGNNDPTTADDPRIVELSSNSPFSGALENILAGNNNGNIINSEVTQPIITTPESEALALMPPPPVPVRRSQFTSQQQQQQTSNAAMALLSNLNSSANAQATNTTNNSSSRSSRPSSARQRNASSTGIAQIPSAPSSASQSLQPLTRATNGGARGNVAAFLTKSYNMVNEPSSNNLIKWSDDGQSFIVVNHVEFAKEVLPKFFKHNNFSSFVRQLNMYGFHKVPHLQQGVLMPNSESEQWEFSNPHFQKNQPDLLNLVSRKKASAGNEDKDALTMDLGHILQEVQAIKRHQVAISTDLKNIERDHLSLWQESIVARERHQRQQETIDKILRFLASVFSGDKKRALVPNKKARLTITDGEIDGSSSVDDGRRLVEEEDEEEVGKVETLPGGKRKRPTTNDATQVMDRMLNNSTAPLNIGDVNPAILAMLANAKQAGNPKQNQMSPATSTTTTTGSNLPTVSAISSTTPSFNLPDYLTGLPNLNFPNVNNSTINNTLPGGLKFDPSNLTIPTALLPNALSPVHHDMLRSISMANAQDTNQTPPPLAPLPPSLSQTTAGASAIKGVDQITQEMEQLQRSIEALSQHGLIADHFDFDDDTYLSLADSYDSNGLGNLDAYQGVLGNEDPSKTIVSAPLSSAPLSSAPTSLTPATKVVPNTSLQGPSSSVGANPRISTVEDDLEDLLDMDPV